jgi:hypothetical protein
MASVKTPAFWVSSPVYSGANLITEAESASETSVYFYECKVAGKYEVLDGSAHVMSRVHVSQSTSVACRTQSLCAPPVDTSDHHGRRRFSFRRFCACKVTCSREPVSSVACCAQSVCAPSTVVPVVNIHGATSLKDVIFVILLRWTKCSKNKALRINIWTQKIKTVERDNTLHNKALGDQSMSRGIVRTLGRVRHNGMI